jgi:hypothetical protein
MHTGPDDPSNKGTVGAAVREIRIYGLYLLPLSSILGVALSIVPLWCYVEVLPIAWQRDLLVDGCVYSEEQVSAKRHRQCSRIIVRPATRCV